MIRRSVGFAILALLLPLAALLAQEVSATAPSVVEVTVEDYQFEIPAEIPSGWVTFKFKNVGNDEFYLALTRLPAGKAFEDYQAEVMANSRGNWTRHAARQSTRFSLPKDVRSKVLQRLSSGAKPWGGIGVTEPGETVRVTISMQPGTYAVECAVQTAPGSRAPYRGMARRLEVIRSERGSAPAEADARLSLSSKKIEMSGELRAGVQTIAVQTPETVEGLSSYSAYLLYLPDGTGLAKIEEWMEKYTRGRFRTPVPGISLGGVHGMPHGRTAFLTVDLEPGRYVWVAPNYTDRGLLQEFSVE